MARLLSPKQVASAIGVSESSLKRWCDQGLIETQRTSGGHRRIGVSDVIRYVRESNQTLARPEILGLPPGTGDGFKQKKRLREALFDGLVDGDLEVVRRLLLGQYLQGESISVLCDEILADAMHEVGDRWECGELEVYQEHRASEVMGRALYELRSILPATSGPIALGGTPSGDHYRLATAMAELTLVDMGWRATSLGTSLPFFTLTRAIEQHRPVIFWLSISHLDAPEKFLSELAEWLPTLPEYMKVAIGGQALVETQLPSDKRVVFCSELASLKQLAATLQPVD